MSAHGLRTLLLLLAILCVALAQSSSTACNNSPSLCSKAYNNVTYLGAHDSPFVRDASNGYSASGNQFYNSTVQLSAGVRLLTAQVQRNNSALHVCHTSCELFDAGTLSSWLGEVKAWMDSNPNDVVTVLLVNGPDASASELASQYQQAGITTSLAYTPSSSNSSTQQWPTLQSLISNGTRMMNFVASLSDNTGAPYLMDQYTYMFQNSYNVNEPSQYTCEPNSPSSVANNTALAIRDDLMPLMNHFLYSDQLFGIQTPNETYASTTNAPSGGIGNLGASASECTTQYGKSPTFIVVDFFNMGPAITTVDRLNGVSSPVGRTTVSTASPQQSSAAGLEIFRPWHLYGIVMLTTVCTVILS